MNAALHPVTTPQPAVLPADLPRVLVVDDSQMQRRVLSSMLTRWGYATAEAGSAAEALQMCAQTTFDLIVSDWIMPGMTGIELCGAIRSQPGQGYAYFILLTSKSGAQDTAIGLDSGADDFLTKPIDAGELRARLAAGQRILKVERELQQKNRLVTTTLAEIRAMYDSLNRDLKEARKLQQSLLPERYRDFGAAKVALAMQSCGHIGGDLVGCFPIGARQVGLFSLDVSGHGVASALMTARLAGFLSGAMPERNIALIADDRGGFGSRDPADVAATLNRILYDENGDDRYLTMFYAVLDLFSGALSFVQAGHPHPAVVRADGWVERLGDGGLPIGLIEDARYHTGRTHLRPGDRLAIVSDGVTECADGQGQQFDEGGLERFLAAGHDRQVQSVLNQMMQTLAFYSQGREVADDISAILVDFTGPEHAERPQAAAAKKRSPGLPR